MSTKKRNVIAILLFVAMLIATLTSLMSCKKTEEPPVEPVEPTEPKEMTFLKVNGGAVKDASGEEIYLRGVNVGGLFVTEHWMTGFAYTTPSNDYKSLTQTFIDRFGEEKTKELWAEYRANWWTEVDFQNCADMGMNVLRLPFTYMNVDFDAITSYEHAGENYDFSDLDAFVSKAAEYGMYTILDLHGAYGSHNGQDHSGEIIGNVSDVHFYYDKQLMDLTVKLWSELSKHFKDNPYVAGYDILNEPGEKAGLTSERHWDFYDKVYKAIRQNDDEHIVIFESCWDGKDLPQPDVYGWENCMYSFHHYTSNTKTDEANILAHNLSWNEKIEGVTKQNFGVPIQMGEFTSYTSVSKWDYTLDLLNRLNWHWTSWTYKVWGNMPWGIVNIRGSAADKVDAVNDEYEDIVNKFKILRTDGASAQKYTFSGTNVTLESVFKRYCNAPSQTERLPEGNYLFETDEGYLAFNGVQNGRTVVNISDNYYAGIMLNLTYHPSNDGSVFLTVNSLYMCALDGSSYFTLKSLSSPTKSNERFFPVKYEDGWTFVSYATCKYLTVTNGLITASATTIEKATVFYF